MRFLVYVLLLSLALPVAGLYGVLHNQLSFSISAEYFTHFKYPQFGMVGLDLPDRFKISIIGFFASWWMGYQRYRSPRGLRIPAEVFWG